MITLKLHIARLNVNGSEVPWIKRIITIALALQKKDNIPEIKKNLVLIKAVQSDDFWEKANAKNIEQVRIAMRDLLKYLDKEKQAIVFTNFEDELDFEGIVAREPISQYGRLQSYKDRVESYVRKNRHHLSIDKLRKNIPITESDLLALEEILFTEDGAANKEKFVEEYGEQPLGTFIRGIIGLDEEATQKAFAGFIQSGKLEADQITFISSIVTHLTKNGMMKDKGILFESPFTNIHYEGLTGVFKKEADVISLIKIIDEINGNARVG